MMKRLCNFMFGGHSQCRSTIHLYESQTTELLNQIQELKAINHYQAYELEKKIQELEKQIAELEAKLKLHHGDSMPVQNKKKEKNG